MKLSSLYKGKGRGLILRLAGVLVLLSLLVPFSLISQPATAAQNDMGYEHFWSSPDPSTINTTTQYEIKVINTNATYGVDYDLYFAPPGPTGALDAYGTEIKLNTGGTMYIGPNTSQTFTSSTVTPAGLWSNLALKLKDIPLDAGVTLAYAYSEFSGVYRNPTNLPVSGQITTSNQIIYPSTTVDITGVPVAPITSGTVVHLTITEQNNTVGPTDAHLPDGTDITFSYPSKPDVTPVTLTDGTTTWILDKGVGHHYDSGDTDLDGVLDGTDTGTPPGETWTWKLDVAPTVDTTYTATGNGYDFLGNTVTVPDYPLEQFDVDVNVINPHTTVTIKASPNPVISDNNHKVTLTVTEANDGDTDLTDPQSEATPIHHWVEITNNKDASVINLNFPPTGGDTNTITPDVLNVGETWSWTVSPDVGPFTSQIKYTATGHGIYDHTDVTYPGCQTEQSDVTIHVAKTTVTIQANKSLVVPGTTVTLTIKEKNDGEVDLTDPGNDATNPWVRVTNDKGLADILLNPPPNGGGDTNGPGVLNAGEEWTWTRDVVISHTTKFTATGHGLYQDYTDPYPTTDVTYPACASEQNDVTVYMTHTIVTLTPSETVVAPGDKITFTVKEQNDGEVDLTDPGNDATNPWVRVTNDKGLADILLNPPPNGGGDTNGPGVLNAGETWEWDLVPSGGIAINDTTIFTATGHGMYGTIDVTYATSDSTHLYCSTERTTPTIHVPDTLVTISVSPKVVKIGDSVTLTITEENTGDENLTNPHVDITNSGGASYVAERNNSNFTSKTGVNQDAVLDVGETWHWTVTGVVVTSSTTFTATGHGTYNGTDVTFSDWPGEQDTDDVYVANTVLTISASSNSVNIGDTVDLKIEEDNNGSEAIHNPTVTVDNGIGVLDSSSPSFDLTSDPNHDGVLDSGETWVWNVTGVVINADTTFTGYGDGVFILDSTQYPINWGAGWLSERDHVTISTHHRQVPTLSQWGIIAMAGAFGILLIWTGKRKLARKKS